MRFCLFLVYPNEPGFRLGPEEGAGLDAALLAIAGLSKAHRYWPSEASDPFLNDGAPPPLVLQLYFPTLPILEAAASEDGPLRKLGEGGPLAGSQAGPQAMLVREFPVPDPGPRKAPHCTYLVGYEGPAEDENAWHGHYLGHHPPIMATMPGIRELEVYTRVDWVSGLSGPRANLMQRNKVAFDDEAALSAALHSPVRQAMREDYHRFPAFSGRVTHFPMATRVLRP